MTMKKWLAAGLVAMAAGYASADVGSFTVPANNLIVITSKLDGPAKVYLWDGTGTNSCGDAFILGAVGDDFAKNTLSVLLTARTVQADVVIDYDESTCEVQVALMGQVVGS